MAASRLDPAPHGTRAHQAATVPPQQPRRRGTWHKDRASTAQSLECTTGPLMRLHPQSFSEGGSLGESAPVRTPSDTTSPAARAEQGHELALGKTFATQRDPAGWTGRPSARSLGTFGQHIFDNMESQHTRERPHGQDELCQRLGFFDRTEQLVHAGIIMTDAVAEA